jgi:hypothetical protein
MSADGKKKVAKEQGGSEPLGSAKPSTETAEVSSMVKGILQSRETAEQKERLLIQAVEGHEKLLKAEVATLVRDQIAQLEENYKAERQSDEKKKKSDDAPKKKTREERSRSRSRQRSRSHSRHRRSRSRRHRSRTRSRDRRRSHSAPRVADPRVAEAAADASVYAAAKRAHASLPGEIVRRECGRTFLGACGNWSFDRIFWWMLLPFRCVAYTCSTVTLVGLVLVIWLLFLGGIGGLIYLAGKVFGWKFW